MRRSRPKHLAPRADVTSAEPGEPVPAEPAAAIPAQPFDPAPVEPAATSPADPAVAAPAQPVGDVPPEPAAPVPAEPPAAIPVPSAGDETVPPVRPVPAPPAGPIPAPPAGPVPPERGADPSVPSVGDLPVPSAGDETVPPVGPIPAPPAAAIPAPPAGPVLAQPNGEAPGTDAPAEVADDAPAEVAAGARAEAAGVVAAEVADDARAEAAAGAPAEVAGDVAPEAADDAAAKPSSGAPVEAEPDAGAPAEAAGVVAAEASAGAPAGVDAGAPPEAAGVVAEGAAAAVAAPPASPGPGGPAVAAAGGAPATARVRLKRRWPRRTLIVANVMVFLAVLAAASAYGYVRYQIGSIRTAPFQVSTPEGCYVGGCAGHAPDAASYSGLKSENILLIGNETRQGLTPQEQLSYGSSIGHSGSLADIMLILHLDPANGTASILSIPRDLFSPMPASSQLGPYQKIDSALNDGAEGPNNLASAVQQDLGIPINHFIELNFNGFINSVNALGGINVYFPEPVYDAESLLYIPNPGCHHLNGIGALALVRARHLQYEPPGQSTPDYAWPQEPESDLARIVRTHTFLKIVAQTAKAKGLTNPITANNFISAVIGQMTVDPGLKSELLSLVLRYRHIDVAAIPETTLPTTPVNDYYYDGYNIGDVLFPVQPADNNVIRAWDSAALPAAAAPTAVSVVSITGSYDAALSASQVLASHGLKVTSESAGTVPSDTSETLVRYHPGETAQALDVMKYLSGAVMMQANASTAVGKVEVDLGSSVAVAPAPAKPKPTTASSATATTAAGTATSATTVASSTGKASTASSRATHTTHAVVTTTVPTPDGYQPSASADQQEPWDPRSC